MKILIILIDTFYQVISNQLSYYKLCSNYQNNFNDLMFNQISLFQTSDLNGGEYERLCSDSYCLDSCCTDDSCLPFYQQNLYQIESDTSYAIYTGGIVQDVEQIDDCLNDQCLGSNLVYISNLNTQHFYQLVVIDFPQIFLHGQVLVTNQDDIFIYIFGGFNSSCADLQCTTFQRFQLPTIPSQRVSLEMKFEIVGSQNNSLKGICGHTLIYDSDNNSIYIIGGVYANKQQNEQIWKYNISSDTWILININQSETINIKIDNLEQNITREIPQKQSSIMNLCLYQDNNIQCIGGLININQNYFYLQQVWKFDIQQSRWIDITPSYFFNTNSFGFNFLHLPKAIKIDQGQLSFLHYLFIFEFDKQKEEAKSGSLIIYNNKYYSIIQNTFFTNSYQNNQCIQNEQASSFSTNLGFEMKMKCNGNGKCENGVCICDDLYYGDYCDKRACINDCLVTLNDSNICLTDFPQSYCRCSISDNLGDVDCSKKFCVNDCSFNGSCNYSNGECICIGLYFGTDCSVLEVDMT